jgi:hypothetical protein
MKRYIVTMTAMQYYSGEFEANSKDEAIAQAEEALENGDMQWIDESNCEVLNVTELLP